MTKTSLAVLIETFMVVCVLLCFSLFSTSVMASDPSSEPEEDTDFEDFNMDDLYGEDRLELEEEEEIVEGDDTALIYQEFKKKIAELSPEDQLIQWELYLKKYPNSVFKVRIEEDMDRLQDLMFSEELSFEPKETKDDGLKELNFSQSMLIENLDPRTKVRFGFEMGLPQYISLIADYEHQLQRDLSVHGGIRKRYTGWNLELGTRYAFIKSARTHTLVTGMADLRLNADPGFPALRPQLAAGKRFFLPNDFFIDAQAQLGTDLIFYNGAEPRLVGGFNVTFAPSDTIRLFLEGNVYMKDFSFDQGPFAFNTIGFGMKIMDKSNTPQRFETGVGAAVPAYYKYWLGHFGAIMGDINLYK